MKTRRLPQWVFPLEAAALIIIGLIAYWQWTRSPTYALRQIRAALHEHDFAKFQKYVDIESLTTRAIDDMIAMQLLDSSPREAEGNALAVGFVQLVKPRLIDEWKKQINRYVESGTFGGERELTNMFSLLARGESFVGVAGLQREGKICVLGLRFTNNVDAGYVLEAKMRDRGHWQLVELPNLAGVLQAAQGEANAKLQAKEDAEMAKAKAEEAARAEAAAKLELQDQKLRAAAEAARAKDEAEKAEAIERANAAKAAALAHLPSFTNQIVTISTLNGAVYTNIALVRASPDGIIYRTPDAAGGGSICYTNLSPDILETLGIDTNCISIAQERAEVKAAADAYYRAIAAEQGAAAAAAFQADWQRWWRNQQSAQARSAFQARYGLGGRPPSPVRAPGRPPSAESGAFQERYGRGR